MLVTWLGVLLVRIQKVSHASSKSMERFAFFFEGVDMAKFSLRGFVLDVFATALAAISHGDFICLT